VLTNPHTMISYLYRYCLAKKAGFDILAAEFAPRAALEVMGLEHEYAKLWGDFIPRGFLQSAQHILMNRKEVDEER
jgi:hypothetical protein